MNSLDQRSVSDQLHDAFDYAQQNGMKQAADAISLLVRTFPKQRKYVAAMDAIRRRANILLPVNVLALAAGLMLAPDVTAVWLCVIAGVTVGACGATLLIPRSPRWETWEHE